MARRYPRISVVLPYPFALAALPVATADAVYGAVFVTWPGSHPAELSPSERTLLTTACDRLTLRLERAAQKGRRVVPEAGFLGTAPMAGTSSAVEAVQMVARVPDGMCALDVNGRVSCCVHGVDVPGDRSHAEVEPHFARRQRGEVRRDRRVGDRVEPRR
jgi:hypothetical protein